MSIVVKNVSKRYDSQYALKNVSFSVDEGEIVGFIGPNGAGKTTMMRIICGLLDAAEGKVTVNGYDVENQILEVKRSVGYLPENNPLYTEMYVKEYLFYISKIYKLENSKNAVELIIEKTGLGPEQKKKIFQLSKGYRQRLGLAQALIHDPKVLILDEPTTGLDPNQIVEIRNLISQVGKKKTVLMSTHILQEVEAICNRVIIIDKGSIVANQVTGNIDIVASSGTKIIELEFDKEPNKEKLLAIEGVTKVENITAEKLIVYINSSNDIRKELFNFAIENDIKILGMTQQAKGLEEVFRQITGLH